jgi:hypothetical protein
MKYLKTFESVIQNKKILITLSSANSHGVNWSSKNSVKKSAEKWWSLDANVYELTYSGYDSLSNEDIEKKIASNRDVYKFKQDYTGYYDPKFKYKRIRIVDRGLISFYFLISKFKNLPIDSKLQFFTFFVEEEFLIIRGSYIYKVIEYDELDQFIESMKFFFKEYTKE